mmetsp:Transcript_4061/g.12618  ORF Transcript_4061/g.12618 Transcript_4061/m.12618 type:complete len:667 (+) Transcript_4061:340-2340(+)
MGEGVTFASVSVPSSASMLNLHVDESNTKVVWKAAGDSEPREIWAVERPVESLRLPQGHLVLKVVDLCKGYMEDVGVVLGWTKVKEAITKRPSGVTVVARSVVFSLYASALGMFFSSTDNGTTGDDTTSDDTMCNDTGVPRDFFDVFNLGLLDEAFADVAKGDYYEKVVSLSRDQREMFFQQFLYRPLNDVVLAAAPNASRNYIADQPVTTGNVLKDFGSGRTEAAYLKAKPDTAALCPQHKNFVLVSGEYKWSNASNTDMLKGVVFAAASCSVFLRSGHNDALFPFFKGNGLAVELFVVMAVTGSDGTQFPKLFQVHPSGHSVHAPGTFNLNDHSERLELVIWFVALLGTTKKAIARARVDHTVVTANVRNILGKREAGEAPTSSNKSARRSTDQSPNSVPGTQSGAPRSEAAQAASLGGQIKVIGAISEDETSDPIRERHYFHGLNSEDGGELFLKVICNDGQSGGGGDEEVAMLKRARDAVGARVPKVVAHVLTDKFRVIAMEYARGYFIGSDSVHAYAASLLDVVDRLHRQGLLHCDIKPRNVLWDATKGLVVVVDFGLAQLIDGAQSYNATRAFTAPEVIDGKPHSTASDAFSLGKTVGEIAAEHGALGDDTITAIVAGLTETKVEDRWTLSRAIEMLPPSTPGKKADVPVASPPDTTSSP